MNQIKQSRRKQANEQTSEEGSSAHGLGFFFADFDVAFALVQFARFVLLNEHLNGGTGDHSLNDAGLVVLQLTSLVVVLVALLVVVLVEFAWQDVRIVPPLGKHFW
jgi:hypothetical protein